MKVINVQNHNGLQSEVVQLSPNEFVVKFKNQQFNFDNSYNANLKARELVGKNLCGFKYKAPYNPEFLGAQPARAGEDY